MQLQTQLTLIIIYLNPSSNPLEVRPDDVLSVACNVTGQIYRYVSAGCNWAVVI